MLVNKSSTWLPDLNHDATANASFDDVSGRFDHFGKPNLARHRRELSPIKLAFQMPPRGSPIDNRPHAGIGAEKQTTAQNKREDRRRQSNAPRQSTNRNRPAIARHR